VEGHEKLLPPPGNIFGKWKTIENNPAPPLVLLKRMGILYRKEEVTGMIVIATAKTGEVRKSPS